MDSAAGVAAACEWGEGNCFVRFVVLIGVIVVLRGIVDEKWTRLQCGSSVRMG